MSVLLHTQMRVKLFSLNLLQSISNAVFTVYLNGVTQRCSPRGKNRAGDIH